ncbi:hypothetical protein [Rheinheimera sp. F8]|uniref:hypothetical protein n=1 Tax=Rheinheimera sp. F8 TaxID=1763998 RepID=UPI000A64ACB6|nr:hypothetical protein [Rheinheimera sp. F8]
MIYLHIASENHKQPWTALALLTESGPGYHHVVVTNPKTGQPPDGEYFVFNCELYVPIDELSSLKLARSYAEFLKRSRNEDSYLQQFTGPINKNGSLQVALINQTNQYNQSTMIVSSVTRTDSFYRFSPYANDRRIDFVKKQIHAGTYLAPESERNFLSSGLSVVGRYALPSPFPAVYMWRIQPPDGTPLAAGTVRHAFGQAGGGVEVVLHSCSGPNSVFRMKKLPIW